jgi:hypothetical protein
MLLQTENPWGGIFGSFDQALLDGAGMNIVIELLDQVVEDAPAVDQRAIPDRDHNEECGEGAIQTATTAVGKRQGALAVVNYLRAKYGEAGVQQGTDMWELCGFLDSVGVAYSAEEIPVGQGFALALLRNHVAIGALWTAYNGAGQLLPVMGGSIGHWEVGGQLTAPAPVVTGTPRETPMQIAEKRAWVRVAYLAALDREPESVQTEDSWAAQIHDDGSNVDAIVAAIADSAEGQRDLARQQAEDRGTAT